MGNLSPQTPSRLDKEISVLHANSNLSEEEIRQIYEEFNYEAESGTGRMNKKQFRKYYKKLVGDEDTNGELTDKTFAVFDTNHDGTIDFSEFVLGTTIGNKGDIDSKLELTFAMMDTSGDGLITYDEMMNFMEKALKLVGKESTSDNLNSITNDIYKQFGLDKGQKLNKKQFIDGCKDHAELAKIFQG